MSKSRAKQSAVNLRGVNALERMWREGPLRDADYRKVADVSGLTLGTVQRLFINEAPLTIDRFLALAAAFGADTDEALAVLASVIRK